MAKMQILFKGFEELAERIDKIGTGLKPAVNEALEASEKLIDDNLCSAAARYADKGGGRKGYATGEMYRSIRENGRVVWHGNVAEIGVGFSSENMQGFMHSIFVMYGTPRMQKDPKIYNAVRGSKIKKQVADKQSEIMQKHLSLEE